MITVASDISHIQTLGRALLSQLEGAPQMYQEALLGTVVDFQALSSWVLEEPHCGDVMHCSFMPTKILGR